MRVCAFMCSDRLQGLKPNNCPALVRPSDHTDLANRYESSFWDQFNLCHRLSWNHGGFALHGLNSLSMCTQPGIICAPRGAMVQYTDPVPVLLTYS